MVGHYTRGAPAGSALRYLYPKVIDDDQAAGRKNCADNPQSALKHFPSGNHVGSTPLACYG